MAANYSPESASSMLDKLSSDHLECTICCTRFTEPKILDCFHTYCLKCLEELRKCGSQKSPNNIECPVCRAVTPLKGKGIASMRSNFIVNDLVGDIAKYERQMQLFGPVALTESVKCEKHFVQDLSIYCNTCRQVVGPLNGRSTDDSSSVPKTAVKTQMVKPTEPQEDAGLPCWLQCIREQVIAQLGKHTETVSQWVLKKEINTFYEIDDDNCVMGKLDFKNAWDIAVYTDDEILVADHSHEKLIVVQHIKAKMYSSREFLSVNCEDPFRIAINGDNRLVILDEDGLVTIFSEYRLLNKFRPEDMLGFKPTCIAVAASSNRNRIAVGYRNYNVISIHHPNGALKETLAAPEIDNFVTFHGQDLLYTNHDCRTVTCLDSINSTIMFTINLDRFDAMPNGICCDKDGTIYVALRNKDPNDGRVVQFRENGAFEGVAISGCGRPFGITLAHNGDLLVAAKNEVLIYGRCG